MNEDPGRIAIKAPAVVKFLLAYNAARKRWRPRSRPHLTVPNGRQVVASTNDDSRDRDRARERGREEEREGARTRTPAHVRTYVRAERRVE